MQQLITAIERQIKLEEGKEMSRQMMLSNSNDVLFDKPLTKSNPEYLKELKEVLPLLKYLSAPIKDWNNLVDGVINVPDELDPLLNKLGMQLRFHTISGKGEDETVCSMVAIAQKFFHQFKPLVKELGTVANGS